MKKATLILAVITLSIIMFSCGSNSNNDSKTVTIKDSESGAKITANVNQKKLPSVFLYKLLLHLGLHNYCRINCTRAGVNGPQTRCSSSLSYQNHIDLKAFFR